MAESTYRNAKVELIKKGYIIEEEGRNCFTFFTTPREEPKISMTKLKEELNLIGNKIKNEDIELYQKYSNIIRNFKDLNEDEKYYKVEQIIKEMKKDLDELYRKKDIFDI